MSTEQSFFQRLLGSPFVQGVLNSKEFEIAAGAASVAVCSAGVAFLGILVSAVIWIPVGILLHLRLGMLLAFFGWLLLLAFLGSLPAGVAGFWSHGPLADSAFTYLIAGFFGGVFGYCAVPAYIGIRQLADASYGTTPLIAALWVAGIAIAIALAAAAINRWEIYKHDRIYHAPARA